MSGKLESALVIELVDTIKWGAALEPITADGTLTPVNVAQPLDITKYSRRDRELAYRDLVNATAVVKVSLHMETIWNTTSVRPKLQGITEAELPAALADIGASDSTVLHVKNSSLPSDALATDSDLAGRDAMIYEVLAKACEVFEEPPIESPGSGVEGVTAWSLAEGVDYSVQPSPALPLNRDALYRSDVTLAQRDNFVAAYASQVVEILRNPFAFATRLYVRVDGVDARDAEVYALAREYYTAGQEYDAGDEVFYQTGWYRALATTSNLPTVESDWVSIASPRLRVWTAEPALPYRNRIIYDTVAKTLQWFRETTDTLHTPQLFAMSIPGMFTGQTLTTLAQVPDRLDAQYWRQKAARIDHAGTIAVPVSIYHDTTVIPSGVPMTDTVGLTAPSTLAVSLGAPVFTGHRYRLSALIKPTREYGIDGNRNLWGVTGTNSGAAFTGDYMPTTTTPGDAVEYSLNVPAGTWYLSIEYTNVSGTTSGFGLRILQDDTVISDDTAPLLFQDEDGNPLANDTPVTSQEWQLTSNGQAKILKFIWSYGTGTLQINKVILRTADRIEAEYYIKAEVKDAGGNIIHYKAPPTIESTGQNGIFEVVHWDFFVTSDSTAPTADIIWMGSPDLPIQFRKISLAEMHPTFPTPGATGFDAFKWECLRRAERSIQVAFNDSVRLASGTISDFTTDGTVWNDSSSEGWMAEIETWEPRLRQITDVSSIRDGFQYQVAEDGYIVYNAGTYSEPDVFNGTSAASTFIAYGTEVVVNQVGAFRKSTPTDLGSPALMPLGLRFDEPNLLIRNDNEPSDRVPTLAACQSWMIEAGLYVADADFHLSEASALPVDVYTVLAYDNPDGGGVVTGSGYYMAFTTATVSATANPLSVIYDVGVDIAFVVDESGSMADVRSLLNDLLPNLDADLQAVGIGDATVSNRYALVGFSSQPGGTHGAYTDQGHVHASFGSFAAFMSKIPELVTDPGAYIGEDAYEGIGHAISFLSWRGTSDVARVIVFLTDEDRNAHFYTAGGATQAQQFSALRAEIVGLDALLVGVSNLDVRDVLNLSQLGQNYNGKTWRADGAGGFTNSTGGYNFSGTFSTDPTYSSGIGDEYYDLCLDPAIQGQFWNIQQFRYNVGTCNTVGTAVTAVSGNFNLLSPGGTITINGVNYTILSIGGPTTLTLTSSAGTQGPPAVDWSAPHPSRVSFIDALVDALQEDIVEELFWTFTGWFENGVLRSSNPTFSFTVLENRTLEARFELL